MNKYIIKNCPACRQYNVFGVDDKSCCYNDMKYCQDCTDCTMKEIVERCRKEQKYHKEWQKETGFNYAATGLRLADEILQMLDIEECE